MAAPRRSKLCQTESMAACKGRFTGTATVGSASKHQNLSFVRVLDATELVLAVVEVRVDARGLGEVAHVVGAPRGPSERLRRPSRPRVPWASRWLDSASRSEAARRATRSAARPRAIVYRALVESFFASVAGKSSRALRKSGARARRVDRALERREAPLQWPRRPRVAVFQHAAAITRRTCSTDGGAVDA